MGSPELERGLRHRQHGRSRSAGGQPTGDGCAVRSRRPKAAFHAVGANPEPLLPDVRILCGPVLPGAARGRYIALSHVRRKLRPVCAGKGPLFTTVRASSSRAMQPVPDLYRAVPSSNSGRRPAEQGSGTLCLAACNKNSFTRSSVPDKRPEAGRSIARDLVRRHRSVRKCCWPVRGGRNGRCRGRSRPQSDQRIRTPSRTARAQMVAAVRSAWRRRGCTSRREGERPCRPRKHLQVTLSPFSTDRGTPPRGKDRSPAAWALRNHEGLALVAEQKRGGEMVFLFQDTLAKREPTVGQGFRARGHPTVLGVESPQRKSRPGRRRQREAQLEAWVARCAIPRNRSWQGKDL